MINQNLGCMHRKKKWMESFIVKTFSPEVVNFGAMLIVNHVNMNMHNSCLVLKMESLDFSNTSWHQFWNLGLLPCLTGMKYFDIINHISE